MRKRTTKNDLYHSEIETNDTKIYHIGWPMTIMTFTESINRIRATKKKKHTHFWHFDFTKIVNRNNKQWRHTVYLFILFFFFINLQMFQWMCRQWNRLLSSKKKKNYGIIIYNVCRWPSFSKLWFIRTTLIFDVIAIYWFCRVK